MRGDQHQQVNPSTELQERLWYVNAIGNGTACDVCLDRVNKQGRVVAMRRQKGELAWLAD